MLAAARIRVLLAVLLSAAVACSSGSGRELVVTSTTTVPGTTSTPVAGAEPTRTTGTPSAGPFDPTSTSANSTPATPGPAGFTFAFAGDVNFAERTADRLADDPATAFGVAAGELARADLTMVNLETAITDRGEPEDKSFTFRAPPTALDALRAAGVDLATMANNHAADYGEVGLQDSLDAIASSGFPVIGIGSNDQQAYAPFTTTVGGLQIAVLAATQVHDHTLAYFTAGPDTAGVASADSELLVQAVTAAAATNDAVVVYLHWGTEYEACPNGEQQDLADALAAAGATAVIGAHAHVLQGAGWRADGVYVAYGLSNYLWWRSFGNEQDDNGVLTLTFAAGSGRVSVTSADFAAAHLDDTGVPVPATGATRERIDAQWESVRECAGLLAMPPA